MAQTVQSLFGLTPEQIQAQRAAEVDARALQYAQMDPFERANYGIFRGASQLGDVLAQRLGYVDPLVKQAEERKGLLSGMNITDPNSLREAAQKAWQGGQFDVAQTLLDQANSIAEEQRKRDKATRDVETEQARLEGATKFIKRKLPELTDLEAGAIASDKEALKKLLENPTRKTSVVEADGRMKLVYDDTGELIKDIGAASDKRTTIVMPGQGTAKVSDITSYNTAVRTELKPIEEAWSDVSTGLKLLETNNPKASAQVDRLLAKAAGDSQLSQQEVASVASAGSFPQQVVDSFSKFFTGGASALSKQQKFDVLKLYQKVLEQRHANTQSRLGSLYGTSELSPAQVKAGLGSSLGQGKMTFSQDKEARYQEWKRKQLGQ